MFSYFRRKKNQAEEKNQIKFYVSVHSNGNVDMVVDWPSFDGEIPKQILLNSFSSFLAILATGGYNANVAGAIVKVGVNKDEQKFAEEITQQFLTKYNNVNLAGQVDFMNKVANSEMNGEQVLVRPSDFLGHNYGSNK